MGGAWAILGPAWGPKVDLGAHFEGKRGSGLFLGCPGDVILKPSLHKKPPESPTVTRRAPKGVPERSQRKEKTQKHENYDTLISNDPMGVWLHLHPSGGPGPEKKLPKFEHYEKYWKHVAFGLALPLPRQTLPPKGATGGAPGGGGGVKAP